MDKLKPILIKLKRHHFWIVIVLVLGVSAYCWASSVKKLKSEAQSQQSKIKSSFDQVQRSGDDGPRRASHPNAKFEEGMKELITSRQGEVLAAWESQVQQQQSILQWPQNLGDDFVAAVAKLPPVEKMVFPEPKEQDVEVKFRERFRNYIQDELPKLAEMIGSKWDADQSGGEAAPAGSGW